MSRPCSPARTFGFKPQVRVETLAPDTFLECGCMACEHNVRLATGQLHARYPASAKLMDVERF